MLILSSRVYKPYFRSTKKLHQRHLEVWKCPFSVVCHLFSQFSRISTLAKSQCQVHNNDARPIPHVELRGKRGLQSHPDRFSVVPMGRIQIEPEVRGLEYVFTKLEGLGPGKR